MKKQRILLSKQTACYHLVSRSSFGVYFMDAAESRGMFARMLMKQAAFCGVEILGYCLMSNHFHLLVRIPHIPSDKLTDAILLERYRHLYDGPYVSSAAYRYSEAVAILENGGVDAESLRRCLKARMGDVSVFMRELKQRFAIWYNRKFENKGAVWSGRFKSQVIQDDSRCLQMVAAYIDLNPVRAELVQDPKDYPFSSYGAANSGDRSARKAFRRLYNCRSESDAVRQYESFLYAKGANFKVAPKRTKLGDKGVISSRTASAVLKKKGLDSGNDLLSRTRFLIDGGALGDKSFIEAVFAENRHAFSSKRLSGSRKIHEIEMQDLRTLREIK